MAPRTVGLGILAAALTAAAQPTPAFEVASVKVTTQPTGITGGCRGIDTKYTPGQMPGAPPLGRCTLTSGRLGHFINIAFELHSMLRIKGGPEWVTNGDDRFDIEAKVEDPTKATEAQLLHMLRQLLIERFQLKFHWESKDSPGFALVVGKNGPKRLEVSKARDADASFGRDFKPMPGRPIAVTARKYSMAMLANLLSNIGPGPVVDKTDIQGEFDFTLSWDDNNGPSLFTALQDQLGLRFEAQKVPVSLFVIDSAHKPCEN